MDPKSPLVDMIMSYGPDKDSYWPQEALYGPNMASFGLYRVDHKNLPVFESL